MTFPTAVLSVERFVVHRVLKDGETTRTLLVEDRGRGSLLVAKVADRAALSVAARLRLEHEAEVLARIDSDRIAPLVEIIEDASGIALLSRHEPGLDLADRLREGPLPLREAVSLGVQLLGALRDVHDHGVVHRDVKPANIVIGPGPGLRRAVLVDFGLARSDGLDPAIRDLPAGIARYMSPEAAGTLAAPVDERADLYSAGAVLFECLAGRPPFPGDRLGDVLRMHATTPPPDLASLGVTVPRVIEDVVRRLLAKDPADRYQSAQSAIADLTAIAEALDRGETEPTLVVGASDRRRTLAAPAFVGRRADLAMLGRHLEAARGGRSALVLLEAESGGGKSRLLDEMAREVTGDALVLRGQGLDAAARRPFEVLRGVARGVLEEVRGDPAFAEHLRHALGNRAPAVAAALPALGEALGVADDGAAPEAFGEQRTLDALAVLLSAVGRPGRPAAVVLDDCQWADELAIRLLARWHADRLADAAGHVCVLAAFRSEEVPTGHPLRRLKSVDRMALRPLGEEAVHQLVASMAGPVPGPVSDVVAKLSDGSPFMAGAVLLGLVESEVLVAGADGWEADATELADVRASRRAGAMLSRRLVALPPDTRRLLRIAAVLGKSFDLAMTTALLGHGPAAAGAALEDARRRHLVWTRNAEGQFVHDKIREAILDELEPDERAQLHRTAALWLEAERPEDRFGLGHHWDAAGEPARALPSALAAGTEARARYALALAEEQFRIALRGAEGADAATRRAVSEGLGDVCMLRGRYGDAAEHLDAAEELAENDRDRSHLLGKLGELHFKRGDMTAARAALERALLLLGRRVPRSKIGFLIAALAQVLVQVVHTALPSRLGRRDDADAQDDLLAVHLHSRLAHVYWFGAGAVATLWTHLRGMNLAERYPPGPELAQTYSEHAPVMTVLTLYGRGIRYGERSLAIRRELGDVWGEGQSRHFLGVVLYGASRFEECITSCREAVRLLELTGDRWEVNTARWHIGFSLHRLGELEEAVAIARRVYADGVEIGDPQARGISLAGWAKASGGLVPADLVAAELTGPDHDVHTRAEVHQAEGIRLLAEDRPEDAAEVLAAGRALVRAAGLRQEYVVALLPWLATALRRKAEVAPALAPRRRRAELRRARRAAAAACRAAWRYRNNRPHALRERALVAALAGRPRRAARLLSRSTAVAEELGMRAEAAETEDARRRLAIALGRADRPLLEPEGADPDADAAPAEDVTLSLVDRFDAVLEGGRRIATAQSAAAVHDALETVAAGLLRAERCAVVAVDEHGEPQDVPADVSAAQVREAVRAGRPVTVDTAGAADAAESLVIEGVRSCLVAPVQVRGRTVACLYADHRGLDALFGEEEERLALLLTSVAGAALETAGSIAELTELGRTLERRVDERTAELSATARDLESAYAAEQEITEELTRLVRFKDDFMGMVAHDLRSPLTSVTGLAVTLHRRWDGLPEEQRLLLVERVMRNAQRTTEFVENLLQFAHVESGTYRFDLHPYDLGDLVCRMVTDLRASHQPVELVVDVAGELPPALGDEQRHWQVLGNLLSNAVKFSPEGGTVTVAVRAAGPHRSELQVDVTDEGGGIRADDRKMLFRKFSRVEQLDARERAVGTGLGLYICASLVEGQGGRIWVDSTEGRGSTFSFTVPAAPAAATSADQPTTQGAAT